MREARAPAELRLLLERQARHCEALLDAGAPLEKKVAGVAMGLVKEDDRVAVLTDILGVEDHLGDMDFKVVGTAKGVTALQLDNKVGGLSSAQLAQALDPARQVVRDERHAEAGALDLAVADQAIDQVDGGVGLAAVAD